MHASSRRDDDDETDLEAREAPSAGQHVEAVLQREVAQAAERSTDGESRDVKEIAHELRQHAIEEISQSERREQARRRLARVYQFIDYFFFIAYALIGLLIALELLGARDRSGFMRFMHTVTAPLVAPFKGVMPDPSIGSFQLMVSYVIALVVYLLLHSAIKRLFGILARRQPAEM